MKRILLLFCLLPILALAQTSRVTIANGNFYDPSIWSPFGLPSNGDMLTINHAVTLNIDVYYTAGQIKINPGASLTQDAVNRNVWIDGNGSMINHGTYSSHLLYISGGGFITNSGLLGNIDSMLIQSSVTNSGTASFNDFWIGTAGTFNNSGSLTNTDSLLCQGVFTNSGMAGVYDFEIDEMSVVNNSGSITITHDMNNQGKLTNSLYMQVDHDFSNCNFQSLNASVSNNGIFCIGHDFSNCGGDTLKGSGEYYVGNLASNFGVFSGTHTFHTPTGTLALQTGTIEAGVTIAAGTCNWNVGENDVKELDVYPNPTSDVINLSVTGESYSLTDLSGNIIQQGKIDKYTIDLSSLKNGIYLLRVTDSEIRRIVKM